MDIRINELDLTRAGIISVQRDLPPTETSWETDYTIGDVLYRVTGSAFHGRPRGRDADILLALQTTFFRAGCPESNTIELSAAQLLEASGHARNGQYYAALREALLRLAGVKWTLVRTQYDEKRQRHVGETTTTGIIAEMQVMDQATGSHRPFEQRELTDVSPIRITFVPSFATSIRDGFFQILDGELLSRLGQPQARSLYRVLQAHRITTDGSLAGELTFKFKDWLSACGLENERLDNARRTLDAAHERLKTEGYLQEAVLAGRGRMGTIHYTFSLAAEPELVDTLLDHGVTRPVAESLAADHPQRIRLALRMVNERLQTGWKPRSLPASIVDAVRNPKKWGYAAPESHAKAPPRKSKGNRANEDSQALYDPRETALVMLRLHLGQAPSREIEQRLQELDEITLNALLVALKNSREDALKLSRTILMLDI